MIGAERAMVSGTLCEPWSAHKAYRLGMILDIVPALKVDGKFVANPLVETGRYLDEYGRIVHGEPKTGEALEQGKALMSAAQSISRSSMKRSRRCAPSSSNLPGMPDQDLRGTAQAEARRLEPQQGKQPRLARAQHDGGGAGRFPRLQRGHRENKREIDFVALRQRLAKGEPWTDALAEHLIPKA